MFARRIRPYLALAAGMAVGPGVLPSCSNTVGSRGFVGGDPASSSGAAVSDDDAAASSGTVPSSGSASTGVQSGSTSGSGAASSGHTGATSGSGSPTSGSKSGTADASTGSSGSATLDCSGDMPPNCGAQASAQVCDLKTNTCCIDGNFNGTCLSGASTTCPNPTATAAFHCLQACDCPTGQVCCGVVVKATNNVSTQCQTVANGGSCMPVDTANQGSAQICASTAECKNGQACMMQTCTQGAMLKLCGLQSGQPFMCH
ncbi:MAG TPA: hypothetical protein VKU41_30465 [Polyangiaceae bacterium]|nr:hypothetical protein [Polyangiaceae bacterium]